MQYIVMIIAILFMLWATDEIEKLQALAGAQSVQIDYLEHQSDEIRTELDAILESLDRIEVIIEERQTGSPRPSDFMETP